jgi:hypothetical protein
MNSSNSCRFGVPMTQKDRRLRVICCLKMNIGHERGRCVSWAAMRDR